MPTILPRLKRDESLLFVVDVQERLTPVLHEAETLVRNCVTLATAAGILGIPTVVTEQNPSRLGGTLPELNAVLAGVEPFSKMLFSAFTPEVKNRLEELGKRTVLVCGAETHVCVLQTVLDLVESGYNVFLARDAVSSRSPANIQVGWERARIAGAIPTSTESAIFEWLGMAGTDEFRRLLPLIR